MYEAIGFEALGRAEPLDCGISAIDIQNFENRLGRIKTTMRGYMILRHGKVISEKTWKPYVKDDKVYVYSVSKSFTSTAIGLAVDDGLLEVSDKVISFFPDKFPKNPNQNLLDMSIHDLLCMSTGHTVEPFGDVNGDWMKEFFSRPVEKKPGTHFVYNSMATYILSGIVEKVTGRSLMDFLGERVFKPLGFDDVLWDRSPEGITAGGWGIMVRMEDIAKLGQLYLDGGIWKGKRIISREWVQQVSMRHADNSMFPDEPEDWRQGYGYQFWLNRDGGYRADGMFGQYLIIMPKRDIVVVLLSETYEKADLMDAIWRYILKNPDKIHSEFEEQVQDRVYSLESSEVGIDSVRLSFSEKKLSIEFSHKTERYSIEAGRGFWTDCETTVPFGYMTAVPLFYYNDRPKKISAHFHWLKSNVLEVGYVYRETPHRDKILFEFDGDNICVTLTKANEVPFSLPESEIIKGTA